MPWDSTTLCVRDLTTGRETHVDGSEESVSEPVWQAERSLTFIRDRTGWRNLYRWSPKDGAVGRGEHPHGDPHEREDRGERRVREVGGQKPQQHEAQRRGEHPARREPACTESVRQVPGGRPGAEQSDRERHHIEARVQLASDIEHSRA
jgi:hypothetical protein